jgi:hypothetical protein
MRRQAECLPPQQVRGSLVRHRLLVRHSSTPVVSASIASFEGL